MVVTAILGLLVGFVLVDYRSGSQLLAEQRSLKIIAQAVRTAQVKALGSEKSCASKTASCKYYGAHFEIDSAEIIVFGSADETYSAGIDVDIEVIILEKGVLVTGFSSVGAFLDILFAPPDPTTTFNPIVGSATITITGGKSVTIGLGGSVDTN